MSFDRVGRKLADIFLNKMVPKLYELMDEIGLEEIIIKPEGLKKV